MKRSILPIALLLAATAMGQTPPLRTFSNAEGKTLEDRITRYDYEERMVTLEKAGKVPLATFSEADQRYILQWNQAEGFKSTMRFKTELKKGNWARMKHEQTTTPFLMDAVQLPGKTTPTHRVEPDENFEEYNAVYLEAEGYEIVLRNQNFFPIDNIVVESKIFYEQEYYRIPDDLFTSLEKEYDEVASTNKVRFLSETIPVIVPREDVVLHSECAVIIDHQVNRNALTTTSEESAEGDEGDEGDEEMTETVDGFGEWDDHGRRRTGKVIGCWVRIGVKGPDGEMVWREMTDPASLPGKVSWEPAAAAQ